MKRIERAWSGAALWLAGCAVLLGASSFLPARSGSSPSAPAGPDAKYIGTKGCMACHKDEAKGDQFGKWEAGPHAKAFATLASPEAMAAGKERGVEKPQESGECLRCHVTAYGVDEKRAKKVEPEMGVGCESCHGPGDDHRKARMKAVMAKEDTPVGADEIVSRPPQETCLGCHNDESPTFKPFCYYERKEKIRHLRPDTDESEILVCGCGEDCPCEHGSVEGCGIPKSQRDG